MKIVTPEYLSLIDVTTYHQGGITTEEKILAEELSVAFPEELIFHLHPIIITGYICQTEQEKGTFPTMIETGLEVEKEGDMRRLVAPLSYV